MVDSPGDNLLAEFASAVDAVQWAVEIQQDAQSQERRIAAERRMEFRIGINVGDVSSKGDRLYGDGVNIAARLEALAEGGGICISGTVYDQVENKLALGYEYLGEQSGQEHRQAGAGVSGALEDRDSSLGPNSPCQLQPCRCLTNPPSSCCPSST